MAPNVKLSDHAVSRYKERCAKEHLTDRQARAELARLIAYGTLEAEVEWAYLPADAYLVLSDGVALALRKARNGLWIADTTLTRGGGPPEFVEARRARKKRERRRRAARRVHYRDHRPEADAA